MSYEQAPQAPPGSYSSGPSGPRAGFWQRFGAALLDALILAIPSIILVLILGRTADQALQTLMSLAYFTYFEGGPTGATLGKRALGIRVYDLRQGGPIGYGRGFVRWISRDPVDDPDPARLLLDALGRREADLARQDRRQRRRPG